MITLRALLRPDRIVDAHCDIPCGVYDPEQARIEAESCLRIIEKYDASDDKLFRSRCIHVKEERAELVKHHLDVLWHDYFKPEHLEKYPGSARDVLEGDEAGQQGEAVDRCRCRQGAPLHDRHGRRDVEGDRRRGEDARQRATCLSRCHRRVDFAGPSS